MIVLARVARVLDQSVDRPLLKRSASSLPQALVGDFGEGLAGGRECHRHEPAKFCWKRLIATNRRLGAISTERAMRPVPARSIVVPNRRRFRTRGRRCRSRASDELRQGGSGKKCGGAMFLPDLLPCGASADHRVGHPFVLLGWPAAVQCSADLAMSYLLRIAVEEAFLREVAIPTACFAMERILFFFGSGG